MPWERGQCLGCGGTKPPGRGLRYCDSCERRPFRPKGQKTPCAACGSREGKRPKKQYCDECLELRKWRSNQRRKAKKVTNRRPCDHCGGRKSQGKGRHLCDPCAAKLERSRICKRCGKRPARAPLKHICNFCHAEAKARRRQQNRLREQIRRNANPDVERRRKNNSWRRTQDDPERRARLLEARRLRYRMKAQSKGLQPRQAKTDHKDAFAHLPGRPFAAALYALAEREASFKNPFAVATDTDQDGHFTTVCGRAGVPSRLVSAWRRGERDVRLNVADDALDRIGMFWWEVWTEETVRLSLFTVHVYVHKWKVTHGRSVLRRLRVRSVPYGDAGPDLEMLKRIEALMTGELVAAA